MLTHGSLFSGIGGFDLASEWMGWKNVFHCEYDPFCQKVLKHHFPNSKLYKDVRKFDATDYAGRIDLLSGGFPCQPFSNAGLRKGTEDERHLWPEMLRIIREVSPKYVVGENVRGLLNWSGGLVFSEFGLLQTPRSVMMDETPEAFQARKKKNGYVNGTKYPNLLSQVKYSGLLKTPTKMDGEVSSGKKNPTSGDSGTLAQEIMSEYPPTMQKLGMLPTPNSFDWNTSRSPKKWEEDKEKWKKKGVNLHNPLKQMASHGMLPTPLASDNGDKVTGLENQNSLTKMARSETGKTSQLNPLFVEEMMGFPENWTVLPFQSGEKKV